MIAFSRSSRFIANNQRRPPSLRIDPIAIRNLCLRSTAARSAAAAVVGGAEGLLLRRPSRVSDDWTAANFTRTRSFSAAAGPSDTQSLLARTLYRQLLRWCDAVGEDVPLDPIPPVTLAPPHVDAEALCSLAAAYVSGGAGHWYDGESNDLTGDSYSSSIVDGKIERASKSVPAGSIVDEGMITMPAESVSDVRNVIRTAYGLNAAGAAPVDAKIVRDRVDLAFEALKSLNQLSEGIEDRRAARERNADREGVKYHVGQVLRHKGDRWRGVVCGWRRRRPSDVVTSPALASMEEEGRSTSLTQKDYSAFVEPEEEEIFYNFVLDLGDSHMLGGRSSLLDELSPFPMVAQSDLEPVAEPALRRIRSNWTSTRFERYDAERGRFVPNDIITYEYPLDGAEDPHGEPGESGASPMDGSHDVDVLGISKSVIEGAKRFAAELQRRILDATSCPEARNLGILEDFRRQLMNLSTGDVQNAHERLTSPPTEEAPTAGSAVTDAARHLRPLLRVTLELSEMLWQRQVAFEHKSRISFPLGSVVRHRLYGYRGVVVAWDPEPAVDVSRWDGLINIENPQEKPFYHVIPDRNDCVREFGGERPFRYVCEENLEICPSNDRLLELDMEPGWERVVEGDAVAGVASAGGAGGWRYEPPDELKFKYAEGLGQDEEILIESMMRMKEDITQLHLGIRGEGCESESIGTLAESISMDNLFALLQAADNFDDAVEIEESIKEIWKAHSNYATRCRLDSGIAVLLRKKTEAALTVFEELVADDPAYFEAWNKKSTCHFMLGEMEKSMEAARRAVELCPRHFQAMSGMGLVQYETRRYRLAAESFRQSIGLDPWSPVSSRLAASLDLLKEIDIDEEGAEEGTTPYE